MQSKSCQRRCPQWYEGAWEPCNDKVKKEYYIEEEIADYQSDNASVAEINFITAEEKIDNEQALACVIDGNHHLSFTQNSIFKESGSSCHIRNKINGMFEIKPINYNIAYLAILALQV